MSVLFTDVFVYDEEAHRGFTGPTDVLVRDQRIAAVGTHLGSTGRARPSANARVDGVDAPNLSDEPTVIRGDGHHLLVPGLINAHFHSPANHLKGALPSLPLELFMLYESPADAELAPSPREAYLRTMLAALEMLRSGTTSVQDDAFLMPAPEPDVIDAVLQAYDDCGIRASVALDQPELAEVDKLPFLGELIPTATEPVRRVFESLPSMPKEDLLERYRYLFNRWHGAADGRLTAALSASAPQRVSVEYFAALDELSAKHQVPLYLHVLETKVQRALATEHPRFAGRSLVRYTAELGLLSERTNVIHAVWADDADLDLIASSGAVVVHNPVSNLRLGSGVMPFRAVRDRGIPVALGVDEAICNDAADLWNVVKMTGLVHNITGEDSGKWPQPLEILDALWGGGAAAMLRAGELGRIAAGCLADLVLLDLNAPVFTPLNDVAGQLVYCETGNSVVLTMVDGRIVSEHHRVTSVDEDALLAEARALFAERRPAWERARAATGTVAPVYREIVRRAAAADLGVNRWVSAR